MKIEKKNFNEMNGLSIKRDDFSSHKVEFCRKPFNFKPEKINFQKSVHFQSRKMHF